MPRSPKGVVTRPIPEWDFINVYTQYTAISGPGTGFQNAGGILFNNSTNSTFVLWDWWIGCWFNSVVSTQLLPQYASGGVGYGAPKSPASGQGFVGIQNAQPGSAGIGSTYTLSASSTPSAYSQNTFYVGMLTGNATSVECRWKHDWPYLTLPPNYGFMIFVASGNTEPFANQTQVGFTYEVVQNPYP